MSATAPATRPALLIVDDDPLITDTLQFVLARDFDVTCCGSREQAVEHVRTAARPPALALVDLGLPPVPHLPTEGFALIGELLAHLPGLRILVLSGQSEETNGRRARALGAIDLVAKPCEPGHLKVMLNEALRIGAPDPRREGDAVDAGAERQSGLVGESPAMRRLREQIALYAGSTHPALIEGESGSGKERVAACLHHLSARSSEPYLALNCAAISPTLVEPTLFGYAKGAFTGASTHKSGYFEEAGNGTLFLDEIGELPIDLQAKLLRVLENGEFQRVGETQTRVSTARIIAATNRDLRREIRAGGFRSDLYHRLSVFTLSVPPLREMGEDRMLLLEHFTRLFCAQGGVTPFRLDAEAERAWRQYQFPGNVRELRNIVIRLVTKHAGQTISRRELESEFDLDPAAGSAAMGALQALEEARAELARSPAFSLEDALRARERLYIEAALSQCQGNVTQAARILGINRTTLYGRLEVLGRGPGGAALAVER
ncbi:MAG: sigma-54-dependent Fis family transcriptional regulator [Pseudomonadota bacterium]|nr:sigma-54-dependent Fis family transcriptional regulator [Pseudomonadota bacterium]